MLSYQTDINNGKSLLTGLDVGLKAGIAIILTILAIVCQNQLSLLIIFLYLGLATFLLGSNFQFLKKNLISYGLIFLLPYFFGLSLSVLFSYTFSNNAYVLVFFKDTLLRMVKIFFVWYIGSLYICSTPLNSMMGMLKKVFSPLNSLGVPVTKYLTIIMFIIMQLNESVSSFKNNAGEQVQTIFKNKSMSFQTRIKGISNILVSFIADSLYKTEEIQKQVEQTNLNNFAYSVSVSRKEIFAILIFIVFFTSLIFLETI